MLDWVWPNIQTQYDARRAAIRGAWAAFLVSFCTALITYLHVTGKLKILPQLNASAYIDAVLFLVIGIGISKMSRIAALAGFVLYVIEQYYMFQTRHKPAWAGAVLVLLFAGAFRGTLKYHRLNKENEKKPFSLSDWLRRSLLPLAVLISVIAGLTVLSNLQGTRHRFPRIEIPLQKYLNPKFFGKAAPVESTGIRVFYLKSGKTIQGRVIFEDKDYYTVEVFGGRHEIVVKEDIVQEAERV
ncbi:MAG TPA: hypothetical protein PKL97_03330 [Candidatus Omnitrophota bacterium]|nr:hypothetical protein [Candidatus Omnitrophota bacterium]